MTRKLLTMALVTATSVAVTATPALAQRRHHGRHAGPGAYSVPGPVYSLDHYALPRYYTGPSYEAAYQQALHRILLERATRREQSFHGSSPSCERFFCPR